VRYVIPPGINIVMMKTGTLATALLLIILTLTSCRDKTVPDKDILIPESTLVDILTDIYLSDALMDVSSVHELYRYRDTISNQRDILKRYGYTTVQMDSTLKYYFIYKPKKLENIYDKVTGRLLEMESTITGAKAADTTSQKTNLWNGNVSYLFPDDYETDSIAFSIPLKGRGLYHFTASYQLFPDDESIDPMVVINFNIFTDDKSRKIISWEPYKLKKDGKATLVTLEKELDVSSDGSLTGYLFYHSNKNENWHKHARIMDISIEKRAPSIKEVDTPSVKKEIKPKIKKRAIEPGRQKEHLKIKEIE